MLTLWGARSRSRDHLDRRDFLRIGALGLGGLIVRELRTDHPIINLRVLKERNFAIACVNFFFLMVALYAASMALPG